MMRRWLYPALILVFSAAGLTALAATFYMPQIREALVFEPARRKAEAAVLQIAAGEQAAFGRTGRFVTLSAADTLPGAATLGINWTELAGHGFLYDAALQANKQLRVRALPKPDAVSALKVPPQMYVADLSPKGEFVGGGWHP